MFGLAGRTAIVTGAARGLGLGMAQALAEAGASVALIDVLPDVATAATELRSAGHIAHAEQCDFLRSDAITGHFDKALAALGGTLDILVNNAGIHDQTPLPDLSVDRWNAVLQVNVTAAFQMCQGAARVMIPRRRGKIINVASIRSTLGALGACAYGTSKGAILQLTRSLSNDLAPHGIQVNAIAPGYMATALTDHVRRDAEIMREIEKRIPAGRWGEPKDVGGLCVFLASAASDYVSGAMIPCDGGYLAR